MSKMNSATPPHEWTATQNKINVCVPAQSLVVPQSIPSLSILALSATFSRFSPPQIKQISIPAE
jgi:hypothetical protein